VTGATRPRSGRRRWQPLCAVIAAIAGGAPALQGQQRAPEEQSVQVPSDQEHFTDPRDRYRYPVVRIGGLRWFAENLRFRTPDSRCYELDEANCADHGRLYRLADAERACPAGWRVPSEVDWRKLELAVGVKPEDLEKENGRGDPAGKRLKFGGDTGFNVRYSGWIDPHRADSSRAMGRNAAYWATTPGPPDEVSATAWHRDVAANRNSIWRSPVNVTYWLSVRCVGG
jgi:uncharacterized protein (TIGR02145 family)